MTRGCVHYQAFIQIMHDTHLFKLIQSLLLNILNISALQYNIFHSGKY